MCGICGAVSKSPLREDLVEASRKMSCAMVHRGPDSDGRFRDTYVALAMRRLGIIDLAGGGQPLYNEDSSLVLVANGEIYNFVELRSGLAERGHRFATNSDCETILHLYEEKGLDCVHDLRGMFAFALWDSRKRRLILARDRMGEKPLYLYQAEDYLIFASELRALLQSGFVPFDLDPHAVNLYFHYQYVPEPMTPVKGVRKLDAGYMLVIDLNPWTLTESCYWRMEDADPIEGDPKRLIREELEKICEIVIRSDVPVGIALSGGLDSSVIAAIAASKYPGTMHAFSIGYPGRPPCDESQDAQDLADYLKMPFHRIELDTEEMVRFFPELICLRDDPIADISGYGYYSVMKEARDHGVPVMLQGQGGDELFWGYPWIREAAAESFRKELLVRARLRGAAKYLQVQFPEDKTARGLYRWGRSTLRSLNASRRRLQSHLGSNPEQMVFYDLTPDFRMASDAMSKMYTRGFCESLDSAAPYGLFTFAFPWVRPDLAITSLICSTYLRENGIAQADRLSMASSVELRLPFMDHRLVETVIGLRKVQSDLGEPPKAWLKDATADLLPQWVFNRPKRGFAPPVREWFGQLFDAHGASLEDGYLVQKAILTPESGRRLAAGPHPSGAVIPISFKALVLEQWCRAVAFQTAGSPKQ